MAYTTLVKLLLIACLNDELVLRGIINFSFQNRLVIVSEMRLSGVAGLG
jgi:hypothetical protein